MERGSEPQAWDPYKLFELWAAELGRSWPSILKDAKVANPAKGSRSSRARARQGGAPRARARIQKVLAKLERERDEPTEIGAVMTGLDEWNKLGDRLARANRSLFLQRLEALRQLVDAVEKDSEADRAFATIK